jgi:hypothetical protein
MPVPERMSTRPLCSSLSEMRALRGARSPPSPTLVCETDYYPRLLLSPCVRQPLCAATASASATTTTTTTTTTFLPSGETQQTTTVTRTALPPDACLFHPDVCSGRRLLSAWCASCQRRRLFPELAPVCAPVCAPRCDLVL